jgi:hypothetical protein
MPIREFIDPSGKRWTVWATIPGQLGGVPKELQWGWLTFQSGAVRRRMAPIPRGWEEATAERLQLYCSSAQAIGESRLRDRHSESRGGQ